MTRRHEVALLAGIAVAAVLLALFLALYLAPLALHQLRVAPYDALPRPADASNMMTARTVTPTGEEGYSVQFETGHSVEEVIAFYEEVAAERGWPVERAIAPSDLDTGCMRMEAGELGTIEVSAMYMDNFGTTFVVLDSVLTAAPCRGLFDGG